MKTSFAITKYAMQEIRPTIKFILFYFIFFFHFRVCLRRKLVKWQKAYVIYNITNLELDKYSLFTYISFYN